MNKRLELVLEHDCENCKKKKKNSHDCQYHKQLNAYKLMGRIDPWTKTQLEKVFNEGQCPWVVYK